MNKRLHVIVSGRVQGVGFRSYVEYHAVALDLTGWVRNLYSGEVEVTVEGIEPALQFFLSDLERGPDMAHVTDLKVEWLPATGQYPSFDVRTTWISD
jgi:acylphosphatase